MTTLVISGRAQCDCSKSAGPHCIVGYLVGLSVGPNFGFTVPIEIDGLSGHNCAWALIVIYVGEGEKVLSQNMTE